MNVRYVLGTAILLVALVFSGCLANDAPSEDVGSARGQNVEVRSPGWYYESDEFPADLDHDHADPALHAMSHNMDFVASHACTTDGTTTGYTDIKELGDYLYVGQGNGFCILDISDPTAPKFVSHFEAERSADIDVSADGNWVFHATQRNTVESMAPSGANTVPGDGLPRGLLIVDVSDKANPAFESYFPVPTNGVHTVHYHKHQNGDDLVLVQTYDWVPPGELGAPSAVGLPSNNAPMTQRVHITRLAEVGGRTVLEPLSVFTVPRPADEQLVQWFPHDCTAQLHPVTGQTIMYCAYWDAGMVLVDITDPGSPVMLSQYNDPAPSNYNQYHYVLPSDQLIAGRHITVGAPELPSGPEESGYVRAFDTTDPTNPVQLAAWTLPGSPPFAGGFLYSPHQFDIHDGKIYMGHNHAGTWVIDISDEENLRNPKSAAFVVPHGDETLGPGAWPALGSVWVAVHHKGYVYSSDTANGIFVHHYRGDALPVVAVVAVPAPAGG